LHPPPCADAVLPIYNIVIRKRDAAGLNGLVRVLRGLNLQQHRTWLRCGVMQVALNAQQHCNSFAIRSENAPDMTNVTYFQKGTMAVPRGIEPLFPG
jgi:hypothetical protein